MSVFPATNPTYIPPCPVHASPNTLALLDRLHAQSLEQENRLDPNEVRELGFDSYMKDKFIALDQDKCWFVYQMMLAIGARNVVEAGTSFGVSTIYLALAIKANSHQHSSSPRGKVIATENESTKAARARAIWADVGEGISEFIDLREGDLLQTLKEELPVIDLLVLDIWAPMALPTLQLVEPRMRQGALVIVDNSIASAERYADLQAYMRASGSGYTNLTVPYSKGLELSIWRGRE